MNAGRPRRRRGRRRGAQARGRRPRTRVRSTDRRDRDRESTTLATESDAILTDSDVLPTDPGFRPRFPRTLRRAERRTKVEEQRCTWSARGRARPSPHAAHTFANAHDQASHLPREDRDLSAGRWPRCRSARAGCAAPRRAACRRRRGWPPQPRLRPRARGRSPRGDPYRARASSAPSTCTGTRAMLVAEKSGTGAGGISGTAKALKLGRLGGVSVRRGPCEGRRDDEGSAPIGCRIARSSHAWSASAPSNAGGLLPEWLLTSPRFHRSGGASVTLGNPGALRLPAVPCHSAG